jgi:hypothetical protein
MLSQVKRYYYFSSEHVPTGNYNQMHPCGIVRKRCSERGWYINSHYKISRFIGIKLGPISFGMISGYRPYRVPYIIWHWKNTFYVPAFFFGNKLKYIKCTYGGRRWKSTIRMAIQRMKRNGEWDKRYK